MGWTTGHKVTGGFLLRLGPPLRRTDFLRSKSVRRLGWKVLLFWAAQRHILRNEMAAQKLERLLLATSYALWIMWYFSSKDICWSTRPWLPRTFPNTSAAHKLRQENIQAAADVRKGVEERALITVASSTRSRLLFLVDVDDACTHGCGGLSFPFLFLWTSTDISFIILRTHSLS